MRKLFLLLAVMVAVGVTVKAQDTPKAEIYGTYSFLRADIDYFNDESLHGFGFGVQGNPKPWLGLVFEYGGNYGKSQVKQFRGTVYQTPVDVDTSTTTYLFGPRFSARSKAVTAYAHGLFGLARNNIEVVLPNGLNEGQSQFAFAIGGGIDINLGKHFALRAGQFDYLPIHSDLPLNNGGSSWLRNFRYQTGIVYKF